MSKQNLNVYLLIDNGLLQGASASCIDIELQSRPAWLVPIYTERALEVSPFLVDLEAAYEVGSLDQVMGYLNALNPALHLSIIETTQNLEQLSQHLRRFIFIRDPAGKQFTLRYADCAVLASLSSLLTEAQWSTMKGSISRWGVHDRSGRIVQLRPIAAHTDGLTPLCLNHDQMVGLDEASEPDHCIAKVKMMHHVAVLPGNAESQYSWAQSACQAWRASGNSNSLFRLFLAEAALITEGKVLHTSEIRSLLLMDDAITFRSKLHEFINQYSY